MPSRLQAAIRTMVETPSEVVVSVVGTKSWTRLGVDVCPTNDGQVVYSSSKGFFVSMMVSARH